MFLNTFFSIKPSFYKEELREIFKKEKLPAVGLFDIIEHIEDDLKFIESIYNCMNRKGRLYLTTRQVSVLPRLQIPTRSFALLLIQIVSR